MILVIDMGNTNIAFGVMDDKKTVMTERIYTDPNKTVVEYAITLKTILELNGVCCEDLEGGIISSSVPPLTAIVRAAAEKILNKRVLEVGPGLKSGLDIKIDDPAQLGPDLLVGAVAGIAEYGAPLIMVDMGTCTTICVVNEKRQFIGGIIMPGVMVSLQGMSLKTAHLPKISVEPPKKLIGSNTIDCMKSGVLYGNASCIDGMVQRIREEMGGNVPAVATGGMAHKIIPYCKESITIDDQLLLKGLYIIYKKNTQR